MNALFSYFWHVVMLKKHRLLIIITTILTSLIGLALIQINWLNKSIDTNRQIFIEKIDQSTKKAGEFYRNKDEFAATIYHLFLEKSSKPEDINTRIKPIIDSALVLNNLPLNYDYGIYKHKGLQQNQLIFGTTNLDVLDNSTCNQKRNRSFGWSKLTCNLGYEIGNDYHLAIFPSYKSFIINKIKYSLGAFVIFITLIILGFYYLLKIINKQKKVSEIKNDFINNLTHEFKTPIFSMSLASKALRQSFKNNNPHKFDSYMDVIDNESNRLKRQVDKILQLSLLDAEIFQLQKKKINIHEQLEAVVKNLKLVLNEKNGIVKFNFKAENHTILADDIHVKNVWYNIIDNAIKYCEKEPMIHIETINKNNYLQVSIKDNGIGMASDKQKIIFDRFYRVPTGNIHNAKGFGIGLSYAKSIINLHDGEIDVSSKLNFGSIFKIILPINDN